MTSYSRDTQLNTIIHFFIVPFIITVISSVGICVIHCNCTCKKERPKYRRPRIENIRCVFIQLLMIFRDFNNLIFDALILTKTIFSSKKLFIDFWALNFTKAEKILIRLLLLTFWSMFTRLMILIWKTNRYKHGFQSYRPSIVAQRALLSKKASIASRAITIWELETLM